MLGQQPRIRIGGPLTPVVKKLMILNGAVFVSQLISGYFFPERMEHLLGLHHTGFIQELMLWQVLTYMFLHGGWFHVLFNLLGLWMFAGELEEIWGGRLFARYYIFSGVGAGLFIAVMNVFLYQRYAVDPVTIGASGAIYAVLLAYGMTWPDRKVLLYFVIPIKIKYLVVIFGLIEFFGSLSTVSGSGGTVSHIGHLGGLVSGLIFMMVRLRNRGGVRQERERSGFIARIMKKIRMRNKKREIDDRIRAKKIIDASLEKIAKQGMSSLSHRERKDLEWARKHYYPDRNDTRH